MTNFASPFLEVKERASSAVALPAISTSIPLMQTTAIRGPINLPQFIVGAEDYVSIFGGDDTSDGFEAMIGFFNNGGQGLLVNRVAHYTDITDPSTLTAVAASLTLNTAGTAATSAEKTTAAEPFDLSAGNGVSQPPTLTVSIDGAASDTATVNATPSVLTAPGAPGGVGTPADTLTFTVNGVTQVYTVPGSPPTSAADWALDIAAQLPGVFGSVAGGAVVLTTDRHGSSADVDYVSGTGTAGADSGFGAGPVAGVNAGPNEVADLSAVTAAELDAILTTDWTGGGGITTAIASGAITVTTVATGSAASLSVVTGTAATVVGFSPAGATTGADAGAPTVPVITVNASSEGEHGNTLSVTTTRRDRVVALVTEDLAAVPITEMVVSTSSQFRTGMQIRVEDSVTTGEFRAIVSEVIGTRVLFTAAVTPTAAVTATNSPTVTKETFDLTPIVDNEPQPAFIDLSMSSLDVKYYFATVIGSDITQIDPRFRFLVADLSVAATNTTDPRPVNVTNSILSGGVNSSPVTDNDFTGSAASNLGIFAADTSDIFSMSIAPGIETTAVHNALLDYAALRNDHVAVMDMPEGLTPQQTVTYKNVTANLFGTFGIAYAGRIKVVRQSTGVAEGFPAVGHAVGAYARTDQERNVSEPPAGVEKGQLRGVVGMADNNIYGDKANRDLIYPEGINPIYSKPGRGVVMWGQNTLDPLSDRGAIGVRRAFIFLRKSILELSEFVLFEKNTTTLRGRFRNAVTAFLTEQRRQGVLSGDTDDEAFYIICDETNNTPSVINARKFVARIGVNVIPGIDFATITIERDTRALDAELAS